MRSSRPGYRLLATIAIATAALGLSAAGAAAPAAKRGGGGPAAGGLTIWVDHLPRGLEPLVRVSGGGAMRSIRQTVTALRLRPGSYTVVGRPVHGGSRSFYPRHPRVRVRVREGGTAVALVDYINIVPRTTKAFSPRMARRLRSASPARLVFRGGESLGLQPGDVVLGGPGPRLPQGILRRVLSVRTAGARTVVRTADAELTDALPRGGIDLRARARGGARARRGAGRADQHGTIHLPGVNLPIDRTLVTRSVKSKRCSANAEVALRGGLVVDATFQISASWFFVALRKLSFTGTLSERADLALSAELQGRCEAEFTSPSLPLGTYPVPIGPFTIPITPEIRAHLGFEADGTVAASTAVHQLAELTAGLSYSGGRLTTIHSATADFTLQPPQIGSLEGHATLRAGPRFALKVPHAAGLTLGADAELGLDVTPLEDPAWTLSGALVLSAGMNLFNIKKDVDPLFRHQLAQPIATARGGGHVSTPPEIGLPPVRVRGLAQIFPRPDLGLPPVDSLPDGTALTIVCSIRGAPVAGSAGVSDLWHGLDDGNFVNDVSVISAPAPLPECQLPPGPTPAPTPEPTPTPTPLATPPADGDGDGVPDRDDACPATAGIAAAHGCARRRGMARTPDGLGYWIAAEDGGVFTLGQAIFQGSEGGVRLNAPVVGIAAAPDGSGYWTVAADGGVFAHPGTLFYGSRSGMPLNAPMVGIAATPTGRGYWLAAADGGVFAFGDAVFIASLTATDLNGPVVGIVGTPTGGGYWLVAADGGVFAFGDAGFFGSLGASPPPSPIVGMAATPDGGGYWLVAANGKVYRFGNARDFGSDDHLPLAAPIVGIVATPDGGGYWLVGGDGGVFAHGDAAFHGRP